MNDPYFKLLNSIIREARIKAGLSQMDLAHQAGMCSIDYNLSESGRRIFQFPELRQMCNVLDLNIEELHEQANEYEPFPWKMPRKPSLQKVIGITGLAGGTGSSTLTKLLANEIAKYHHVTVIDAHHGSVYHQRKRDLRVFKCVIPKYGVFLIDYRELIAELSSIVERYDYTIIDLPPIPYIKRDKKEPVLEFCDYVFAPFNVIQDQPKEQLQPESRIVGNINLIIEYQKTVWQDRETKVYGIPFRQKMSEVFHETCYHKLGLELTPVSFLENPYFSKHVDTINPLPGVEIPTTRNARDLMFHLMEILEAHPLVQDLEAIDKRSWEVLFEDIETMTEGEEI